MRRLVQEIDPTRPEGRVCRVRFLSRETLREDQAWLGDTDLFAA
jgi:hypothetical protein